MSLPARRESAGRRSVVGMSTSWRVRMRRRDRASAVVSGVATAVYAFVGRWNPFEDDPDPIFRTLSRPMLVMALLAFGSAVLAASGQEKTPVVRTAWLPPLLVAWVALSGIWAIQPRLAHARASELVLLLLVLLTVVICVWSGRSSDFFQGLFVGVLLLGSILALFGLLALGGGRLAVLGGGPNTLGRHLGTLLMGLVYLALRSKRKTYRVWAGVFAPIVGLLVLATGSRGAIVASLLAGMVLVVKLRPSARTALVAITVVGVAVFLIWSYAPASTASVVDVYDDRIVDRTFENLYLSQRDVLFTSGLECARTSGLIGLGTTSFASMSRWPYPHNVFLEVGCEAGVAGLVVLVLTIGTAGVAIFRSSRPSSMLLSSWFILALVGAQVSGDIVDNRAMFVYATLLLAIGQPHGEFHQSTF